MKNHTVKDNRGKGQVVGFVFDRQESTVVLIRKNHPDYQKGKWNGIGGQVEQGELSVEAIRRECLEECGLDVPLSQWKYLEYVSEWELHVFFCNINDIHRAKTLTKEEVKVFTNTETKKIPLVNLVKQFMSKAKKTFYQNI